MQLQYAEGPASHITFTSPLAMEFRVSSRQPPPPYFGRLSHMLSFGYIGKTFGPTAAKRHLCHNLLCYVEDQEDTVITQDLLRPDYSYPGLPRTVCGPSSMSGGASECLSSSTDLLLPTGSFTWTATRNRQDCRVSRRIAPLQYLVPDGGQGFHQTEDCSKTSHDRPKLSFAHIFHLLQWQ